MKSFSGYLVRTLLILSFILRSEESDAMLSLNSDNFQEILSQSNFLVVEFYSLGCPHCQDFAPVYESLESKISKELPNVKVGKVDVDAEGQLANQYDIARIPRILLFSKQKSEPVVFKGSRTEPLLLAWIKQEINYSEQGFFLQLTNKKLQTRK